MFVIAGLQKVKANCVQICEELGHTEPDEDAPTPDSVAKEEGKLTEEEVARAEAQRRFTELDKGNTVESLEKAVKEAKLEIPKGTLKGGLIRILLDHEDSAEVDLNPED